MANVPPVPPCNVTFIDYVECPRKATGECGQPMTYMVTTEWADLCALGACPCSPPERPWDWPDAHRWSPAAGAAEIAAWRDVLEGSR